MPNLPVSIQDYFTYHPVRTPERQAAHDRINNDCRQLFEDLSSDLLTDPEKSAKLTAFEDRLLASVYCRDSISRDWAARLLNYLRTTNDPEVFGPTTSEREPSNLMQWIQYVRMSLNQGATIDEITDSFVIK